MKMLSTLMTDFYKYCHQEQYDGRIVRLVSYGTPRGCRLPNKDYVINFGVQAFCKEYLVNHFNRYFFSVPVNKVEELTREFLTSSLPGANVENTVSKIVSLRKLGYLPISLRTLPEGGKVDLKCPNIEIVTTHDDFAWIGGFIESLISSYIWKPMIDATVGHWYRETANKYYEMTADNWQIKARSAMSEFGFRGADSPESGIHSGAGWLLSFDKTATCAAIPWINEIYNVRYPGQCIDVTPYFNVYLESHEDKDSNDFLSDVDEWYSGSNGSEMPDWVIPKDDYLSNRDFIIEDKLVVRRGDEYELKSIDIDVVGKGLISTEHSVMCSSTALKIEEMKSKIIDVTEYYNKYPVSRGKVKFLSDVRDCHNDPNMEANEWLIPHDIWMNRWFKIDGEIFKYSVTHDKFWKGTDEKLQEVAETKVVMRLLTEVYPNSSFSMVSDSYDYWRMVTKILPILRSEVLNHNGTLFVRGDSGDPVKIVAGYVNASPILAINGVKTSIHKIDEQILVSIPELSEDFRPKLIELKELAKKYYVTYYHNSKLYLVSHINICSEDAELYAYETDIPEHELKGTVECLWDTFGGSFNSKNYMVLDSHVRAIYGDSITQERQELIYRILKLKGFSVENVALGAGSFSFHCYQDKKGNLYPYTRDTYNWAQKATYGELKNGNEVTPLMIHKDPKTDNANFKKSMKGCCAVYRTEATQDGNFKYYLQDDGLTLQEREEDSYNEFVEIFKDSRMVHEWTFSEIRNLLNNDEF